MIDNLSVIAKHQHYVWQYYLKSWTVDKKLFCYITNERKLIKSGTNSIAGERFFYKSVRLTEEDKKYISLLIDKTPHESLREIHRDTLRMFQLTFDIRDRLRSVNFSNDGRIEIEKILTDMEKNLGERFHGRIEQDMIPILNQLKAGNDSFYSDQNQSMNFLNFISHQLFRTPALRKIAKTIKSPIANLDPSRTWLVESYIFSVNVATGLIGARNDYMIIFLNNDTSVPFITADQPVVNLKTMHDKDLKLYYPISPTKSVLLTKNDGEYISKHLNVTSISVEYYNQEIYKKSLNQI